MNEVNGLRNRSKVTNNKKMMSEKENTQLRTNIDLQQVGIHAKQHLACSFARLVVSFTETNQNKESMP